MTIRRSLLIVFISIISILHSYSQKQTNFWYFGTLAGLDFNSGSPVALSNGVLNTTEGCAAISDVNGNLLFYTNGVDVWDKTHTQMPNGNGLMGDVSSTQSALIVPVPGSATLYYIFTVDYIVGPNGFRYSIVDMTQQAGNGDVTVKNTLLQNNVVEKLSAVYHCNGTDIWVMVHDWGTNAFYAYLVTAAGINPPVVSNVGTIYTGNPISNSVGQMKFSNAGTKLASAIGYQNTVDVFDFDNKIGIVSNPLSLTFNLYHVYGVEFSPDETKLYTSYYEIGNAGWIAQFDLTAANVQASQTLLGTSFDPNYIYGLQIGPDNKIYASIEVTPFLGVVNSPNTVGIGCNYNGMGVNLDPSSMGIMTMLGLPGFIASYFNPAFPNLPPCPSVVANFQSSDTVICENDCINFTDISAGSPISWQWTFPGASTPSSIAQNPANICFPAAGNYTVTLVASDGTTSDTVTNTITVIAQPTVTVSGNTTICQGSSSTLTASGGGTYSWSTTATTASITVSPTSASTYTVIASVGSCADTTSITVNVVSSPTAAITCVNTICAGQNINLSASGGTSYSWSTGATTSSISPPTLSTNTYSVIVSNGQCADTTSCTVNVLPPPSADAGASVTITAGSSTVLNASGGGAYVWSPGTGLSCTNCQNPSANPAVTTTYSVIVTDGSGCTAMDSVTVYVETPIPCNEPYVGDAFSPNNDGANDILYVRGSGFKNLFFAVYDRWGEKVFDTDDVLKGWDGTYKNKLLAPGVFVYYLKANCIEDEKEISQKGNITLFK